MLGVSIKFVVQVLSVNLDQSVTLRFMANASSLFYISTATAIFFLPLAFGRRSAPEEAVQNIATVDAILDRADLSKAQRQMIWRSLLERYVRTAGPDLKTPVRVTDLLDEQTKERTST